MHYEQLLEEKEQLEKKVSQLKEDVEELKEENDDLEDKLGDYEDDAHSWQQLEGLFEGMDLNNLDTIMKIESFVQHCKDMPSWKFDQMVEFYKVAINIVPIHAFLKK